ncbi:pro-resilin-like [Panulirus ornatus]|uniref:pro-resilin-like n=1 Tax=Panulirus ornatus TaxID=150431 RepID=UPI003A87842B
MKVVVLVLLVATAAAARGNPDGYGNQGSGGQGGQHPSAPAQYSFQWDVDDPPSSNFYGHQEERDGVNTQGSYYVQLPDGRLLRVEYTVDGSGYHPVLTYEGEANFQTDGSGQGFSNKGQGGQGHSYA